MLSPQSAPYRPGEHQIRLDGQNVVYTIKRSSRKTLGFIVSQQGLEVRASRQLPLGQIEDALNRHSRWILKKLQARADMPEQPALHLTDGVSIPLLGQQMLLRIQTTSTRQHAKAHWHNEFELHLQLPEKADTAYFLEQHLRRRAAQEFSGRLAHYCSLLGVKQPALRISSARTRWGSASSRSVSLNWRLLHFPWPIIDHVIAHEAAHLREANHGSRFYAILASLDPDHIAHNKQLRMLARALPVWNEKMMQTKEEHL